MSFKDKRILIYLWFMVFQPPRLNFIRAPTNHTNMDTFSVLKIRNPMRNLTRGQQLTRQLLSSLSYRGAPTSTKMTSARIMERMYRSESTRHKALFIEF